MTARTYSTKLTSYAPYTAVLIGLLLLLAALSMAGSPSVNSFEEDPQFMSPKMVGQLNLAPPPYCPKGPGTHGKGTPPANTPGKGDPGARQRPCG